MRSRRWCLVLLVAANGCTCRGEKSEPTATSSPSVDAAPTFDLHLQRTALIAFGNTIPLPVSVEFTEEVPALRPPLERAAKLRPGEPLTLRVARDVPYGQLTRLMQAALPFRVTRFAVWSEDGGGTLRGVPVNAPGASPTGRCWARAWIGPDARVLIGMDAHADAASVRGVLVNPSAEGIVSTKALDVLRRVDGGCLRGQLRIYSQPTARVGPSFDLASAVEAATPRPHVSELMFAVPSIGPLDAPDELVPP